MEAIKRLQNWLIWIPKRNFFRKFGDGELELETCFLLITHQFLFSIYGKKMVTRRRGDSTLGAAYQSVLSNIRWIDTSNDSPFIRQIQTSMNNDNIDGERLSIRFNVDMYQGDYRKDNFTIGRVTGKIYR